MIQLSTGSRQLLRELASWLGELAWQGATEPGRRPIAEQVKTIGEICFDVAADIDAQSLDADIDAPSQAICLPYQPLGDAP